MSANGNSVFHDPAALLASTEESMDGIPSAALFNDSTFQRMRERWCAAMFGIGYSQHVAPCNVVVNDSNNQVDVDFLMRTASRDWEFRLAEVQLPGRR